MLGPMLSSVIADVMQFVPKRRRPDLRVSILEEPIAGRAAT
jgi:hypothetical protein